MFWHICFSIALFFPLIAIVFLGIRGALARSNRLQPLTASSSIMILVLSGVIGAFAVSLPLAFIANGGIAGVLTALYYVLELVTLQLIVTGDVEAMSHLGDFGYAYYCLLELYRVISPLLALTAIASVLTARIPALQIKMLSANILSPKEVHAFYGINRKTFILAKSVLDANKRAFMVFFNVSQADRNKWSTELKEIRETYRGRIIVAPDGIDTAELKQGAGISTVTYLMMSDDCANNVSMTLRMREKVIREASKYRAHPKSAPIRLFCRHENKEDGLIFDSSSGSAHDSREFDKETLCEVVLFDETEQTTFELLARHPLFSVLDRPSSGDELPRRLLIMVIGLGELGQSVVRNCFWIGRMIGVDLRIVGFDRDAELIESRLRATCPEMMAEHDSCLGKRTGLRSTIELIECDVLGSRFSDLALDEFLESDGVYTVMALGDDNDNLEMAIRLQRLFEEKRARGQAIARNNMNIEYCVLFRVRNSEIKSSVECLTESNGEKYKLSPFGDTQEVYSVNAIVDSHWTKMALQTAASYQRVWSSDCSETPFKRIAASDVRQEYNKFEVKKLSNLTSALHIPYRLWSIGINPDAAMARFLGPKASAGCEIKSNDEWLDAIGVARDEVYDVARRELTIAEKLALEDSHPTLSALAKLEHDRWAAFYQSVGWREISPTDMASMAPYLGLNPNARPHQSEALKIHCFVCNSETMRSREDEFTPSKDVAVYDRAIVVDTFQILTGGITY